MNPLVGSTLQFRGSTRKGMEDVCNRCNHKYEEHAHYAGDRVCGYAGSWNGLRLHDEKPCCCCCFYDDKEVGGKYGQGMFRSESCDDCRNRRLKWGGPLTQGEIDAAERVKAEEIKRKQEAEAAEIKRKQEAEAAEIKRKQEAEAREIKFKQGAEAKVKEFEEETKKLESYIASPSGSEMKAWLLHKGIVENDVGRILLQFIKPEYEVTTLLELFALEDEDIDEILEGGRPMCPTAHHVMVSSTGTYSTPSFICNRCRASASGERWHCGSCKDDLCFKCEPQARGLPLAKRKVLKRLIKQEQEGK